MQRTAGARVQRGRKRTRLATAAVLATGALTLSLLPAAGAVAAEEPGSAWGKEAPDFTMPEVKVGSNEPARPEVEAEPSEEVAQWRAQQKKRVQGGESAAARTKRSATTSTYVPEGQGNVPWHKISNFAVTDALTARIDYSTGNLMLTRRTSPSPGWASS